MVEGDRLLVRASDGTTGPLQLMGVRLASAAIREDWTRELIDWLPAYRRHGMNAAVVFFQGSSGGWTHPTPDPPRSEQGLTNAASFCERDGAYVFEPDFARQCRQAAFHIDRDYAVDERIGGRMRRIVRAMAAEGMFVVVGLFYFRVFQEMREPTLARYDFRRAARRAAEYLRGERNVLWYPYNEFHSHPRSYGPAVVPEHEIADEIKAVDPSWLVGGAGEGLDVVMIDGGGYFFDYASDRPVMNVETFGWGAGGNDRFSGRCERHGIWDEGPATVSPAQGTAPDRPATKQDFYAELDGAMRRPSYHLFAHFQGWHQGSHPRCWAQNFMGMSPGAPDGPAVRGLNMHNPASPAYAQAVLVDDDNQGRGVAGSRGVRWYWRAVRERYGEWRLAEAPTRKD